MTIYIFHIDAFTVSKDEKETKEDTGESKENALYITTVCQKTSLEPK